MNKELLHVKNLGSKSKNKYVYKNITFKGYSGEIIGLLGHNGAGKSTMLRNIANLEVPLEGEIYIENQKNDINLFKTSMILIPDVIKLVKNFTILKQVQMISTSYGYDEKFLNKYLKILKLDMQDTIGDLSKGNQEILQLLIMLSLLNTKVILLDEPFSAVDIFRRDIIIKMLIETSLKDDKLLVVTTHLIAEIETILSRVIYLDNGELIIDKDIEEIQQQDKTLVEYLKDYFTDEEE